MKLETPALEVKGSSLSHRLGSVCIRVKPGKVWAANPTLGSPQCPQHIPQPPGKGRDGEGSTAGTGTDGMRPLGREDHPCLLEHPCPAQVQLPRCDPAPCSISPTFIIHTHLLFPDLGKFWKPWDKPPLSPDVSGGTAVARLCLAGQGHVAQAGVGTGPWPWSRARLQLRAQLGALSISHTELPLLLSRAALMS